MVPTEPNAVGHRIRAYIGLGSNLGDPEQRLRRALAALACLSDTRLLKQSSLYRSLPMGPPGQPDYVNAAAEIETRLTALRLLEELQNIERAQGRVRGPVRWGPRTLDLDLLVYGDAQITGPTLTVPHPGIAERAFVLYPLHEIAGDLKIPGLAPLTELLQNRPPDGLERLAADA